ncbi:hypothetical protein JXB01_00825 [Candidatus Micrarchaeota archaeon]|nr:hypothetical protein [Candidatus Micrarchaeota archaeon]
MKPLIQMDDRESPEFFPLFESLGAEVERKRLLVGDFICSDNTVIERKTRADFESSILDKRLFHQVYNLKNNFKNVVFVIEGISSEGRISRSALMGAYASLATDFNIGLFFARDMEGTAEIVYSIAKHEQLAEKRPLSISPKRRTFTLSQTQRSIIEMFPMVGPKLAKNLLEHFGSIEGIINASEEELREVEGMGKKRIKILKSVAVNEYISDDDPLY